MADNRAFAVLATDVALLTVDEGGLKVLVTEAKSQSYRGEPCLPGGLVGYKEETKEAAKRILKDVIGGGPLYLEQLFTFDDPKRDPLGRVVSVAYIGLLPWNKARVMIKSTAQWKRVNNLPELAYDHNDIVKMAVKRLKGKLTYTNIVYTVMPDEFTLTELQKTYELILGRELDKRNFRKKISELKILKSLPKKRKGEANRPARLFDFAQRQVKQIDIL